MKTLPVLFLAAIFLFSVFSGNARAVCICEGGVQSASCKACGTDSSSGTASYTVKPGQQLSEIAGECGVDEQTIRQANSLGDNAVLQGGQVLQVPGGHCGTTSSSSATLNTPGLAWPVTIANSKNGISPFGAPRQGRPQGHQGIDIFSPKGTPLLAIQSGVVTKVVPYESGSCGIQVSYVLDNGWYVLNCHMSSVSVKVGQRIGKCQQIGAVGNTGDARPTSPHDHFEIHPGGRGSPAVDPWPIMKNAEICLK